jgi:hypothetical protein
MLLLREPTGRPGGPSFTLNGVTRAEKLLYTIVLALQVSFLTGWGWPR